MKLWPLFVGLLLTTPPAFACLSDADCSKCSYCVPNGKKDYSNCFLRPKTTTPPAKSVGPSERVPAELLMCTVSAVEMCEAPPECSGNADCPTNEVCSGGKCREQIPSR